MSTDGGYWVDVAAARVLAREIAAEIERSQSLVQRMRGLTTPSFSEVGHEGHAAVTDLREQLAGALETTLDRMHRTNVNLVEAMRAYARLDDAGAHRIARSGGDI